MSNIIKTKFFNITFFFKKGLGIMERVGEEKVVGDQVICPI